MKQIFWSRYKRARILVIDDEEDICVSLKSILERTGKFEVWFSTSPIEGIVLAKAIHPDLILLDIVMPEMGGAEVAERLNKDNLTKDILVVFVTVLVENVDIEKNEGTIGGHPFIQKPIEKEELIARIESLLQSAHATK